jgi:CelD/BcsL family acetyltransferase involved in cellulose biosynthesis
MEADRGLLEAIGTAAARLGVHWRRLASHHRAALRTKGLTYEAWLDAGFATKKRKEFRRLKARLGEAGALSFESLATGERAGPWVEEFLALEQCGWKGKRGTAIGCDEALSEALRAALAKLAGRGDLGFWKLCLDGRAVAMLFAVMAGERAWLVKIAHDEAFQRFSPGVLMVLEATRDLFAGGRVSLVDSCAMPGHPLIDHVWRDRIEITDVMIATPGTPGWTFGVIVATERLRRGLRAVGKRTFHALTGRRVK